MIRLESTSFIIESIVLVAYSYVVYKYNIKLKNVEKILFLAVSIAVIHPIFILLYSLYTLNLSFSFLFTSISIGMDISSIILALLPSFPIGFFSIIASIPLYLIRFRVPNILNRVQYRRLYISYLTWLTILSIVYSLYPPYKYFDATPQTSQGIFPHYNDPIILLSTILYYIIAISTIVSASFYLASWVTPIQMYEKQFRILLILSAVLSFTVLLIRIYYLNLHYPVESFIRFNILDLNNIIALSASILLLETEAFRGRRILGTVPVSAYFLGFSGISILNVLNPYTVGTILNVSDLYLYIALITVSIAGVASIVGTELFKRFFLPWDSDEEPFLSRYPLILILYLIILLSIFYSLNLLIYYSAGRHEILLSVVAVEMILGLYVMAAFSSILSSILCRFRRDLAVTTILTIVLVVISIILLYIYTLDSFLILASMGYILAVILSVVSRGGVKPLGRAVLLTTFIIMLITMSTFEKGPSKSVGVGEYYSIDNYRFVLNDASFIESSESVLKDIGGNKTVKLYLLNKAYLNETILIEKYHYPAKNIDYYNPYKIQEYLTRYNIFLNSVSKKKDRAFIFYTKYMWNDYEFIIQIILMILYAIAISRKSIY